MTTDRSPEILSCDTETSKFVLPKGPGRLGLVTAIQAEGKSTWEGVEEKESLHRYRVSLPSRSHRFIVQVG